MILEFRRKNEPECKSNYVWIRFGNVFDWNANANKRIWERTKELMDWDIKTNIEYELGFVKNKQFIDRYCEIDPDFEEVLYNSFGIHMIDKTKD